MGMHHLFSLVLVLFSIYLGQILVFGDFRVDGRELMYSYVLFCALLAFCFFFSETSFHFHSPRLFFVALVGCGFLVGAVAFSTLDDPFIAL